MRAPVWRAGHGYISPRLRNPVDVLMILIMISRSISHGDRQVLVFPCRVDFGRLSMRKAHAPARHRLTQPTGLEKKVDVQFARRCGTAQHGLKRRGPAEKGFNIQHARGWSITVMARERTGVCTQHLPFPLCVCPVCCVKRGQIRMYYFYLHSHCVVVVTGAIRK